MSNDMDVEVLSLAIGARRGWLGQNTTPLKKLGIEDKGFSSHLCHLAVKGNIDFLWMDSCSAWGEAGSSHLGPRSSLTLHYVRCK